MSFLLGFLVFVLGAGDLPGFVAINHVLKAGHRQQLIVVHRQDAGGQGTADIADVGSTMLLAFDNEVLDEVAKNLVTSQVETVPEQWGGNYTGAAFALALVGADHHVGRAGADVDGADGQGVAFIPLGCHLWTDMTFEVEELVDLTAIALGYLGAEIDQLAAGGFVVGPHFLAGIGMRVFHHQRLGRGHDGGHAQVGHAVGQGIKGIHGTLAKRDLLLQGHGGRTGDDDVADIPTAIHITPMTTVLHAVDLSQSMLENLNKGKGHQRRTGEMAVLAFQVEQLLTLADHSLTSVGAVVLEEV